MPTIPLSFSLVQGGGLLVASQIPHWSWMAGEIFRALLSVGRPSKSYRIERPLCWLIVSSCRPYGQPISHMKGILFFLHQIRISSMHFAMRYKVSFLIHMPRMTQRAVAAAAAEVVSPPLLKKKAPHPEIRRASSCTRLVSILLFVLLSLPPWRSRLRARTNTCPVVLRN